MKNRKRKLPLAKELKVYMYFRIRPFFFFNSRRNLTSLITKQSDKELYGTVSGFTTYSIKDNRLVSDKDFFLQNTIINMFKAFINYVIK